MPASERKRVLRMVPYGLYVITCRSDEGTNAFTGSWLTQCSFHPPLVAIGVNREHRGGPMIRESGRFAVSFLKREQQDIARHFLRPWKVTEEKFEGIAMSQSPAGLPVLAQGLAYLECEVRDLSEVGDHTLFIGEVTHACLQAEGPPLLMSDTKWSYGG
ncbi:MAG TPA: flavin reductase family protein [Armatimonadota bacterium]|jgi:flavin reductase (DIM6/NTAB) family NADH-FMN oxidoreductase RutF